jgi:hypothetical protein
MIQTDFTRTGCCGNLYPDSIFLLCDLYVLKTYNYLYIFYLYIRYFEDDPSHTSFGVQCWF